MGLKNGVKIALNGVKPALTECGARRAVQDQADVAFLVVLADQNEASG